MGKLLAKLHIVLLLWLADGSEAEHLRYKDPKQPLYVRVRELMGRMSLEEKIGQMTQIETSVASQDIIKKYHIGSVLIGGGSTPAPWASAETWMDMADDFQKGALSDRLGIPVIIGIDAIHGHNTVYNATIFPHNVGLGVTRQVHHIYIERIRSLSKGSEQQLLLKSGRLEFLTRLLLVCRDPRWGRCFESYSENHKIVQAMTEIIPGLQGDVPANYLSNFPYVNGRTKVAGCAKHFVGDGGTIDGIDEYNSHRLGQPQKYPHACISRLNQKGRGHCNGFLLQLERQEDACELQSHHGVSQEQAQIQNSEGIDRITTPPRANYTYSVQAAIHAGIDMILVPENFTELIDTLTLLVKKNVISMSRINDAVERILRVKFIMGLFENSMADFSLVNQLGSQEHRGLAREAVRRSLVLLKNGENGDAPLIPLPKKAKKILVAGSHANDIGNQCGGWTIEWHGLSGNITIGTTILAAVKNTIDPQTEVVYHENPNKEFMNSNSFSYAIVAVGELPYSETVGDSMNLTIAKPGYDTISNVCQAIKCVVVIISGRPVVIQPYLPLIDALVAAWLPGTEGQGVADVLFGDYGFTGKLARTWFKTVDQLPMNVGDPHYDPLFPFGFGLTTTPRDMKESQ
ncbi:UNVERIFIED_CONTAM: Beta-glucosidase BoGH3B [Sesamum indicum]